MDRLAERTGIIYCRVSSTEQVNGTSLNMQERLCREYAAHEEIQVLRVFVEKGESAKTANRTEFQKALTLCMDKKHPVNYFIVHKVDRFARNQADHHSTRALLRKYGTELRSVSEPISDDAMGKAMEGMLSVFAELDNNIRAARSKGGMIEKVKRGEWVWTAPLGYKRLVKGGNLVIDEAVARFVRLAFEEWAKGAHSFRSLTNFLPERGFRTRCGEKVYPQLLEKIIRNPIYCGLIRAFDMEVIAAFPPLIEEELYWACQPTGRRRFGSGERVSQNPDFPLRKLVVCEACNHSLTGSHSTGRHGKRYPYYHHHKQGCPAAAFLPKDSLEGIFVEYLGKVSPKHAKYEKAFKAVVMDVWQSNYKKLDAENARVRKEVESLERDRQRIFDLHRAGTYTDQDFLDQKDRINVLMQQKKRYLEEKRIEELNMDEALQYCFDLVRDSGKTWADLEEYPALRTRFQKMLFPQKLPFNGKKFGNAKMALVYELKETAGADSSNLVTY